MNTTPRPRTGRSGFGTIEVLIVLLVLAMLGYAGWHAYRSRGGITRDYSAFLQSDVFGADVKVTDFYSCLDKTGTYKPGQPQTCAYQDQTYSRPRGFTPADVRNYDQLPGDAKTTVLMLAKTNFMMCADQPDMLSVTRVLNVLDGYVYLATGCDGSGSDVLVRQGASWHEAAMQDGHLSCDDAGRYKIPRQLVAYDGAAAGASECRDHGGDLRPIGGGR